MRVLIAPLNWGLGHAARCIPLITRHLRAGDDVVLGGDGESLALLKKHFPNLPYCRLAPLDIKYSKGRSQIWAIMRAMPELLFSSIADYKTLKRLLKTEHFDLIISDNRFGLYSSKVKCVYITHQLHIRLPHSLSFLEPLAERLHARIIKHYSECWVPDNADKPWLAGELSHPANKPLNTTYIGPLSRFSDSPSCKENGQRSTNRPEVVAVLSGPEPQRTLLEEKIMNEWHGRQEQVLIVRGLPGRPNMRVRRDNIILVPYISDKELSEALCSASVVISRSGYSSIMDYAVLGLLDKAKRGALCLTLLPTPGQPEQEYLSMLHSTP